MNLPRWGWFPVVIVAAAVAMAFAWRSSLTEGLRTEVMIERGRESESQRLRLEHARLLRMQADEAEVERLRADRAALPRLRAEMDSLRQEAEKLEAEAAAPVAPSPSPWRPAGAWRNVGRATPAAALETALWAAVGGDIETLATTISLDERALATAIAVMDRLPADVRQQYGSPEEFVALLTARDVPMEARLRFDTERPLGETEVELRVLLDSEAPAPAGAQKKGRRMVQGKELMLRRLGSDWKLLVPAAAVEKYGQLLLGTAEPK